MGDVKEGDRVRLIQVYDTALIQPGDRGTVDLIDDLGTVHVLWDNGSALGLIPGRDRWVVVPPSPAEKLCEHTLVATDVEITIGGETRRWSTWEARCRLREGHAGDHKRGPWIDPTTGREVPNEREVEP